MSATNTAICAWDGGRPVRSRLTRRSSVPLAACGDGVTPASACLAAMKTSTAFFAHARESVGELYSSWRTGFLNAQCRSYSPPALTHSLNSVTCSGARRLFDSGGGIRVSGSVAVMRANSSLLAKSPGSIARTPSRASVAPSRVSRRIPALRLAASGPWHWKQFSESTGRMSRLKSIPAACGLAKPIANTPTKKVDSARRRKLNEMNGITKKRNEYSNPATSRASLN